jgi:Domain of unknown function (DUF4359)
MKAGLYLFSMAIVGLGVAMAVTNPSQANYEAFATQKLTQYLQENTCAEAGELLRDTCNKLVRENQSEIQEIIAVNTQRENFWLLSLYRTDLSVGQLLPPVVGSFLPSYHFETVGLFSGFHVVEARKQ